jgi:multicomponent Na+:H+ antiporter subunit E
MLQKLGLFIALCAAWLLWSGYFKTLLLGLGLVSVMACVYLAMRMRKTDGEGAGFSIMDHIHQLATYWPWLLVEIAKSNLDVAKIVLKPTIEVDPVMIRVKASQQTAMGKTIYGNSITLTPGTITVDVEEDVFLVHALTQAGADGVREGEMDRRVAALER